MNTIQRIRTALAGSVATAAVVLLPGCVGWHQSYPPIQGATMAVNNPNAPPTDELMVLSLRWLIDKYPPQANGPNISGEKRFAINLPAGVRKSTYDMTAERVSDACAPLTEENYTQLPIYHIAQIWVRERVAKVTVLRPRQELGLNPRGEPVYEGITLHIEGGFQPWRIVRWQTWEVGVIDTPDLYFEPATEWPQKTRVAEENGQPSEPVAMPTEKTESPDGGGDN